MHNFVFTTFKHDQLFFLDHRSLLDTTSAPPLPPLPLPPPPLSLYRLELGLAVLLGSAYTASFSIITSLLVSRGYMYIADTANHKIRMYDMARGEVSTLAGSGALGLADGFGNGLI